MAQQTFESCLRDKALYDNVNAVRDRGSKEYKVDSTPTFFINGKKYQGALDPAKLLPIIAEELKKR